MEEMKKAVISILGEDRKGIIANVTRILYEYDVNILDISQTIVSGLFSMILIADISSEPLRFRQAEPGAGGRRETVERADSRSAQRNLRSDAPDLGGTARHDHYL